MRQELLYTPISNRLEVQANVVRQEKQLEIHRIGRNQTLFTHDTIIYVEQLPQTKEQFLERISNYNVAYTVDIQKSITGL